MDIRINSNAAAIAPKVAENQTTAVDSKAARVSLTPTPPLAVVQKTATAEPLMDEVKQAVKDINTSLRSLTWGLEFSIDTGSKRPVIKVIDQQTKEVIRQMPTEQALEFAKSLDQVLGKFLSEKA